MVGLEQHYRAMSKSPNFEDKTYVVKCFLPKTIELIATVNETQEDHAHKSIQMQALADNFASQVEKDGNKNVYGKCFRYVDAFSGEDFVHKQNYNYRTVCIWYLPKVCQQ